MSAEAGHDEPMLTTLLQRLLQMAFVMFGISVVVFLIFFATPGADPASRIAGSWACKTN